jgi:succinate dehydrogenase / fumarate reductase cytochrome b subunit
MRAVLLAAVTLHIASAWSLTAREPGRPPGRLSRAREPESTYASRTMRWGGVILLLFIVYHLMHFTFGNAHPDFVHGDVFHNFVVGFQNVWVSAFYILAMVALGFHLYHGVWSMMQTLGLSHPRYDNLRHTFATLVAVVVVVGNVSFPLAVLTGLIHE